MRNETVKGKQHTVRFDDDDIHGSQVDQKVNYDFQEWLNINFGKLKTVTVSKSKVHTFLGIYLDFSEKVKVNIQQDEHFADMRETCYVKIIRNSISPTLAGNILLLKGTSKFLAIETKENSHA